jgi:hypothetical protein
LEKALIRKGFDDNLNIKSKTSWVVEVDFTGQINLSETLLTGLIALSDRQIEPDNPRVDWDSSVSFSVGNYFPKVFDKDT